TSSMIMEEYHKVNEAVNKIPGVNDWLLLILSNCVFKPGELPRNCALIYNCNFKDFYGYVFASRATFTASFDVINVNSACDWELTFLHGVGMKTAKKIIDERALGPFTDFNDLKRRVPEFPLSASKRI